MSSIQQKCGEVVKSSPANAGDMSIVPGSGRSPGIVNDNPLQCSCLKNPMDKEAWQAIVHRVEKSQTRLKQLSMHSLEIVNEIRKNMILNLSIY